MAGQTKEGLILRAGTRNDIPFILSTWLKSYRQSGYGVKLIRTDVFFENYHRRITGVLSSATTRVAALQDAPTTIIGYLVRNQASLHYIYVKGAFRRLGVASRLMAEMPVGVSEFSCYCDSDEASGAWRQRQGMVYNPLGLVPGDQREVENNEDGASEPSRSNGTSIDFRECGDTKNI